MNRTGSTVFFSRPVCIAGRAAIVGKNESDGPLGRHFDNVIPDALWGEKTFEKCERKLFKTAVKTAVEDAEARMEDIDLLLGGDLLDQIISAGYSARDLKYPFMGLYSACSTYTEALIIAAALADAGFSRRSVSAVSSHFAAAERQYRYPLELGTPKTPLSQNTVTGAAAALLTTENISSPMPVIKCGTIGRVVDAGVTDANNMGAAMAPAAAETVLTHFEDTGTSPSDYDAVITGDLGRFGAEIFDEFLKKAGADIAGRHYDCGEMIFKGCKNEYCGGSGCACGAVVVNAYFLKKLMSGEMERLLFAATGALLSPTSTMQNDSIPAVSHAVVIERI